MLGALSVHEDSGSFALNEYILTGSADLIHIFQSVNRYSVRLQTSFRSFQTAFGLHSQLTRFHSKAARSPTIRQLTQQLQQLVVVHRLH